MNRRMAAPTVGLAAAVTALSAGLLTLPAHGASPARQGINGSVPSWARAAVRDGAVSDATTLAGRVYLKSKDPTGLTSVASAVSTPGNPAYHHYLTADQMMARFGPRADAQQQITQWLTSAGLKVTRTSPNQIAFSGSVSAIDAAFRTQIDTYRVNGKSVHAPATPLSVPSGLGPDVLGVYGLASELQGPRPLNITDNGKSATPGSVQTPTTPCSAYFGEKRATKYPKAYHKVQPYAVCGYEAAQLRGAYGVKGKLTGKGVTVAITDVGALPTMAKDAKKWSKLHGVQPFAKGQYTEYIESGATYNPGWAGEESLDVEAVHGMAPDAKVNYFGIRSDFTWAFDQIVDQHLADVVTDSWTTSPGEAAAYEQDFQMGATEGIGFYFSAGDSGRSDNAYPSSDPWSTSIGGSSIGITESNGYGWETSWETDYSALSDDGKSWTPAPPGTFQSGSGGGTSTTYKQPAWQKGVVPKKFSEQYGKTPMRTTPDIGAEADPTTGFLQGYSSQVDGAWVYGEDRIGGTSLSSPLLAGMTADAIQADGGTAIGFADPAIYQLYGSKSYHDVTDQPFGTKTHEASVRTAAVGEGGATVVAIASLGHAPDGRLSSIEGWDNTTGVGTPTMDWFTTIGEQ
jgi:subtilase family serine protease